MRRKLQLSILAVFFILVWSSIALAQTTGKAEVEENSAAYLEQLRVLADKGERDAQFRLGQLYEEGSVVDMDQGKAIQLYLQAAEQGHAGAQYALGHIYHLGNGVEQDRITAMVWYRKAAEQGDEWSQLALGDQYRIGLAVPRDMAQSAKWYRKAAEHGNLFAQYELGNAYRYGHGVVKDVAQAIKWYQASAEAGHPPAKLALSEVEAEVGDASAVAQAPGAYVRQGPHSDEPASSQAPTQATEADPALHASVTGLGEAGPEPAESDTANQGQPLLPALEEATSGEPPAHPDGTAPAENETAFAATPSAGYEETISQLLALAKDQMAKLMLTTPEGGNAYETYQRILSLQPNRKEALVGIERIGLKYVDLADRATARGDLERTRLYAAKAQVLAPDHPLVQAMAHPIEVPAPSTTETSPSTEILSHSKAPLPPAPRKAAMRVKVAATTSATARLEDLTVNVDEVIFNPANFQDSQVTVTGRVARIFWAYRLVAEKGQKSIVLDIDGLSQAERVMLDTAINKAGFLGQVEARITGTVERQSLATFELAAIEFVLGETGDSRGNIHSEIDETTSLVVPVDPSEFYGQPDPNRSRPRSGDRGTESASRDGNSNTVNGGNANTGNGGNGGGNGRGNGGGNGRGNGGGNGGGRN